MLSIEKSELPSSSFYRDIKPRCGMRLGITIEQASGGFIIGGIDD